MFNKTIEFLSGLIMTIIGGVFLAAALIFTLTGTTAPLPVDPAWATVIISGLPICWCAIRELFLERSISSELLITVAMIASIAIGELFAAGEIALIMAIGAILEEKTVKRAKRGLKTLISLAPVEGRLINNGDEKIIKADEIVQGDLLRVFPGEAIPADGVIIAGDTSVDQSIMTGESLPVDKTVGDDVFCGSINRYGSIDVRATEVGGDSSLQKLIRMVQDAEKNKAPMQRMVDRWASWLVPAALIIAVVTYFAARDLTRAVTVLVVFCPCALVLATPTSIMAAIGQASKHGVIIKSGDALERMGKIDIVAFDKTGTLTNGNLVVSDVISCDASVSEDDLLSLAASAEARSEHPLGKAIAAYAKDKGLTAARSDGFVMIPGKGVSAVVGGKDIFCGNGSWLREIGVFIGEAVEAGMEKLRRQGKAVIAVADREQVFGIVALSDTLRPAVRDMIEELKAANTDATLLTGDHQRTAEYFAGLAGISDVHADLLPALKVEKIRDLRRQGRNICMIGDGVNDAPALKTANVGVAMGSMGSDIAVDAADIALMGDDISKIPYLKRLSNATIKLIKLNISLAMTINFAAIILSILALLNPVTGALVHNAGAVLVIANAALLYDRKFI